MKRLATGGDAIDRTRPLRFSWDGRGLTGYAGDTLASALLGAGLRTVGRSVSLDRPRGIMSAGAEEAHGFAQVGDGRMSEPLVRMTGVDLFEGLVAESRITRGRLGVEPEGIRFDKRYGFCDLLVIGAGPAGLSAASMGVLGGLRVILIEQESTLGGALRRDAARIGGAPSREWIERTVGSLAPERSARILTSTTAATLIDGNGVIAVERIGARLAPAAREGRPEQRLWQIRARRIVIATGALERPLVFADNDRPGIMLATAARSYLRRHGLAPERGLVFTTTDDGYRTALAWHEAGVPVAAVVDPRPGPAGALVEQARGAGIRVLSGSVVIGTEGDDRGELTAARIAGAGGAETIECDLLAVSGGFDPALNLHHQLKGPTRWDPRLHTAVPSESLPGHAVVGAAAGRFGLGACLTDGAAAAAPLLGATPSLGSPAVDDVGEEDPAELWSVPDPGGDEHRSFVDTHRDATLAGIARAAGAGIRHVEHLKRYTLIGTGVEQGRAARTNAGALAARAFGRSAAEVGASNSRPPVEPILFRALAGRAVGARYEPVRTSVLHPAHVALGATFEPVGGQWLRPRVYRRAGESFEAAVERECRAVRERAGIVDVSTLGKIDVQGPDAAVFLDRLYANPIGSLPVGKARYGLLCRLDGIILDDGVVMRLAPDRFFVTTSTGHAASVIDWMEDWLQSEWSDLKVWLTSITEQWTTVAIAGPKSREVVAALVPGVDCSNAALPFMAVRRTTVAGVPGGQVARVSFSGELAFEVSVPATFGGALWDAALAAGRPVDLMPYGTEAMLTLRAEKGYIIVGQEADATTAPMDVGLSWMIGKKDFVGKRGMARPDFQRADRRQMVGFLPEDPTVLVPDGAAIVADPKAPKPLAILGHVTASHRSVALGRTFGLAMVRGGTSRKGERLSPSPANGRWRSPSAIR